MTKPAAAFPLQPEYEICSLSKICAKNTTIFYARRLLKSINGMKNYAYQNAKNIQQGQGVDRLPQSSIPLPLNLLCLHLHLLHPID